MNSVKLAAMSIVALGLAVTACSESVDPLAPSNGGGAGAAGDAGNPAYSETDPFETPLIAGRHIEIGVVKVWNDEETFFVRFELEPDWCLLETHVHAADTPEELPQTKSGNPIPGHFARKMEHECVSAFGEELELEWEPGTEVAIAAHADVSNGEGAWAAGEDFPGQNWATFFRFIVQEADGDDGDEAAGGFAVRYRSFGNTQEPEIFLGAHDLDADERVELDLGETAWSGSNAISFAYDPGADLLSTQVVIGSETFSLEYPNAAAQAEALTGCALADMSRLVFTLNAGDASTSVVLQDAFLNGDELGSLSGAGGPNVFELTGLSFTSGFTISGDLVLSGSFGSDPDLSLVEIATLCPEG